MTEPASRIYKSWTTDSRRWDHYVPRDDDVVIATYPKCGTTWMQRIVDLLIFQTPEARPIFLLSPWIDMRFGPSVEEMVEVLEKQEHRRFIKAHLPLDGLPFHEDIRYIHVARDGRDACMSFFNHCAAYTPEMYDALDRVGADMGAPMPRTTDDVAAFWRDWLTRGSEPGAKDGYPGLSFYDFETSWWRTRGRENVLLVHYNDLLADLDGEMRRIAAFLSIDVDEAVWPSLVEAATFADMKRRGKDLLPMADIVFEGGSERFLYKGSNGRWREEIPAELIAAYEKKAAARCWSRVGREVRRGWSCAPTIPLRVLRYTTRPSLPDIDSMCG